MMPICLLGEAPRLLFEVVGSQGPCMIAELDTCGHGPYQDPTVEL